jgi:hypothetical protein
MLFYDINNILTDRLACQRESKGNSFSSIRMQNNDVLLKNIYEFINKVLKKNDKMFV